jgi:hypothetical protein
MNFKGDNHQQLAILPEHIHVPIPNLMGLDNLGTICSPASGTYVQSHTGPFRIAKVPDMRHIGVILGTHDLREAEEFICRGGESGAAVYTSPVSHVRTNGTFDDLN